MTTIGFLMIMEVSISMQLALVIIHFNRIFHYKSFILGSPHDYGNPLLITGSMTSIIHGSRTQSSWMCAASTKWIPRKRPKAS